MRRSIGIAAGLLSFAFLASPAAAQGKSELTVALSSFSTEVLDPVLGGHVVKYYMSLMFDYLVGVTPDGQLSKDAGLATRWEPSADHRRWTFYLRKGARFHTGDEVTSEDVKFSLQRAIGKRSTTGYAGPLRTLIGDIETPASDRLGIVTKEPTLIVPTYLSRSLSTEGMILPKKYIEANGDDVVAQKPVGSGPDRVVEQGTGSHIKLAAVDRNEIAQSIFAGHADPAYVPMGLSWSYRDIGFKVTPEMPYPYDPARARKLLADAGFAGGFPLTVHAYQLPGLPEGKAFAEAMAGYWQKLGIQPKLIPVDYPAFRKTWFDRTVPGAMGYYNVANRDWIGTYAFLEKQAYTKSRASDTVNDGEIDGMIEQVMRQTDKEKIATLMRNVYTRLRGEHYGVPVVYLHSPYAASKTLGKWNPGTVMYDFFIDELASSKR